MELVEICEKVIGTGLSQITDRSDGYSILLRTLKGFASNFNTRQKMLDLLCQTLVKNLRHMTLKEKCKFLRALLFVEDEVAG